MELILFVILLAISIVIIAIGLFKSEHTEMALIGFVFLFLLSFNIMTEDIQQNTGYYTNYTYVGNLTTSTETHNIYTDISLGGTMSHIIGYWLAIMSVVGFVGVLVALRAQRFK